MIGQTYPDQGISNICNFSLAKKNGPSLISRRFDDLFSLCSGNRILLLSHDPVNCCCCCADRGSKRSHHSARALCGLYPPASRAACKVSCVTPAHRSAHPVRKNAHVSWTIRVASVNKIGPFSRTAFFCRRCSNVQRGINALRGGCRFYLPRGRPSESGKARQRRARG